MDDKELADKIIAFGIAAKISGKYCLVVQNPTGPAYSTSCRDEHGFVDKWNVAGRLLEECWRKNLILGPIVNDAVKDMDNYVGGELRRSIIEVCVQALQGIGE